MNAAEVVNLLGLEPLAGEGGMFRQIWDDGNSTCIYFLLTPDDFSALHNNRGPELWHHYLGDPLDMLALHPDGTIRRFRLGNDLASGERPFFAVSGGVWIGATTSGDWSLVGATMAPGWTPEGFTLADRNQLLIQYPDASGDIIQLTRENP